MDTAHDVMLAAHTTLHVGGPAKEFVTTESTDELVAAVLDADKSHTPLFVLGGGSNVLICDKGFEGRVVHPRQCAIEELAMPGPSERQQVLVRCEAGVAWDDFVAFTVARGYSGVAALSGIPGLIGSACMQNIGAYGQEMASSLVSATVLDRRSRQVREISARALHLGYRTSLLRENLEHELASGGEYFPSPRWIVLQAMFGLCRDPQTSIDHPQLAHALGVDVGDEQHCALVREEVIAVRQRKGMLAPQEANGAAEVDYDRWSSGSFFTNPLLAYRDAMQLPDDAPRYPAQGGIKTSAAWLIEHAGFPKGFGLAGKSSRATLSTRHTLALTNRGHAKAQDIVELARAIRDGVERRFGITLMPETVLVGTSL